MSTNQEQYLGNPNLKKANVATNFTPDEVQEYIKCSEDPVYFIQTYIKIVSLDRGLIPFAMYDFQSEMVEKFHEAHGGQQISVAGGIDPEKIRNLKSCQPEILVVGSYITTAVDPSKAVKTIRQVMNEISV